jgi:hypothetical protein
LAESLEEVGLLGSRARLRLGVAIGQVKQCVDVAEVAVALPAFRQFDLSRELHVFPRCGRHQKVLVGDDGILEQSMSDDDIHAGEFEELENVMEQRLAAVDDDFQAQPLDVRARIAGAGGRLAQLRDLFAEQAEECQ